MSSNNIFFQKQLRNAIILSAATLILLLLRFNQFPTLQFSAADNPTARNPSFTARLLTFFYLPVFNFGLLLFPHTLSFDWGMDAIPPVTSVRDLRSLVTLVFYATIATVVLWCFCTKASSKSVRRRLSDRNLRIFGSALGVREVRGTFLILMDYSSS